MAEKRNQRIGKVVGKDGLKSSSREKNVLSYRNSADRQPNRSKTNSLIRSSRVCKYSAKCGGCDYIEKQYEFSLGMKMSEAKLLLSKFKKTHPIIGMDTPFYYRNKVSAAVGYEKGRIIAGIYERKSHRIIDIEDCKIEDSGASKILISLKKLFTSFKMKAYDEDSGYGLIRHVLIRVGKATKQMMVVIVTASPIFPNKNNFVKELRKLHPNIDTIVQNINQRGDSMVLGDRDVTLFGKGYIEDVLCGLKFRISPSSFYQINAAQTEKLYSYAVEKAKITKDMTVLDTYCGIGTIGMIAAKHAKEVIGVEVNKAAVKDARVNAKVNEIANIRFFEQDATEFMLNLAEENASPDVVFMDPPRSGSTTKFLTALTKMNPKRIVYVSCNMETLSRDLEEFLKMAKEYQVMEIQPFDCFCFTEHVETVVLLSREK